MMPNKLSIIRLIMIYFYDMRILKYINFDTIIYNLIKFETG